MDKENAVSIDNGVLFSHKKNEIMLFTGRWKELEIMMLSEISRWDCLGREASAKEERERTT
jgi:hypothetical protein